jgi:hypothetical protein
MGRTVVLSRERGRLVQWSDGRRGLATIHPSAILRTRGEAERGEALQGFADDLREAMRLAIAPASASCSRWRLGAPSDPFANKRFHQHGAFDKGAGDGQARSSVLNLLDGCEFLARREGTCERRSAFVEGARAQILAKGAR